MASTYALAQVKGFPHDWTQSVLLEWLPWQLWTPATAIIVAMQRRFPLRRGALARAIVAHAAVAMALGVVDAWSRYGLSIVAGSEWPAELSLLARVTVLVVHAAVLNLLIYGGALGIIEVRSARARQRAATLAQARLEARLVEAHLDALKAQLQPHFLFNTLNAIAVLVRKHEVEGALTMLDRLAALLRRSLTSLRVEFGTVREELEFLRMYVEIETVRFGDRLRVEFHADRDTLELALPNLILQPLLENAVRHGVAPRARGGLVTIHASRLPDDTGLRVTIRDDGVGLAAADHEGVGLGHVRARLQQLFPGRHRFELADAEGGGAIATLELPLVEPPA